MVRLLITALLFPATVWMAQDARGNDHDLAEFTNEEFVYGVREIRFERKDRVLGWKLARNIYFGQQRGELDGFGFLWRGEEHEVAVTDEGLTWRKRF